ncbi:MAG TPA: hypothetical protein DHW71_06185 [Gammaproteobacteria bacterium]|nr:prepilin-type N-terminal cleavage/methylation domain-containing protein [Pseudomonadota bacterium]HBF06936.1 hypothetical protein [Gammaproteobacteria bacterium]HCK92554.1 hypothetical protein [Gammaproteobacteria bacterium]|tara:strand:- start:1296 stop:1724 length:429 start_codon:yes stop_codon:yes gene_type:complete
MRIPNQGVSSQRVNIKGMTLIELLVVLAIAAVLMSIAAPSYYSMIQDKRHLQGETVLLDLVQRQEQYFSDNLTYTLTMSDIGYTTGSASVDNEIFYEIQSANCPNQTIEQCVRLIGVPVVDGDDYLSISTISSEVIHTTGMP